jgi:hypothetical protein
MSHLHYIRLSTDEELAHSLPVSWLQRRFFWFRARSLVTSLRQREFDKDGNVKSEVFVGPETYKQFQNLPPPTPEEVQAMNELLERKRAEFYARQRHRKLS